MKKKQLPNYITDLKGKLKDYSIFCKIVRDCSNRTHDSISCNLCLYEQEECCYTLTTRTIKLLTYGMNLHLVEVKIGDLIRSPNLPIEYVQKTLCFTSVIERTRKIKNVYNDASNHCSLREETFPYVNIIFLYSTFDGLCSMFRSCMRETFGDSCNGLHITLLFRY